MSRLILDFLMLLFFAIQHDEEGKNNSGWKASELKVRLSQWSSLLYLSIDSISEFWENSCIEIHPQFHVLQKLLFLDLKFFTVSLIPSVWEPLTYL